MAALFQTFHFASKEDAGLKDIFFDDRNMELDADSISVITSLTNCRKALLLIKFK